MTVKMKMTALVVSALIGISSLAGIALFQMDKIYEKANFANVNTVPSLVALNDAIFNVALLRVVVWQHMAQVDSNKKAELEEKITGYRKKTDEALKNYQHTLHDDKDHQLFAADRAALAEYDLLREKVLVLSNQNKIDEAKYLLLMNQKTLNRLFDAFTEHNNYNVDLGNKASIVANDTKQSSVFFSIMIALTTLVLVAGIGIYVSKNLMDQLGVDPAVTVTVANKIAAGDLSSEMVLKHGDTNSVYAALKNIANTIQFLTKDADMLTVAAIEGRLDTRADATKHQGDYRKIVEGVNKTLDAVITPINEANRILRQISLGNLREKVTIDAKGDHQKVKDSVNAVHSWLQSLIVFVTKIANGDMTAEMAKASEQDQIYEWLVLLKKNIANLVVDVNQSVQYAINGELSNRADDSKHMGEYKKIIKGLNQTMDAVVAPMKETISVLKEMETGNLTISVTGDYKGDYSIMKNALNNTIEKFNDLMGEISNAGDQILVSSKQVSDSSQALSSGASEQASSVEEITSTVNEIEGQTRANAESARTASDLSNDIKSKADNGNSEMKSMLTAMDEISEASENIAKIIKEIDAIAFQTNILALNAAVEAARAGQHGKGFNVVAEEVRNLASRSANAAKETANLIESSIKKVEVGKKLAHNTAEALNQVTNSISKATEIIGSIALSSNEQSQGVAQVNSGLNQISQVTMSNAATAEESASASLELSNQAESFQEMVKRFKLKDSEKSSYVKAVSRTSSQSAHKQQTSQSHLTQQPTVKKKIILQDNASHEKY